MNGHCNLLHVGKEKALLIGVAWFLIMEQNHHFPEVICVDTVSHTNKDKRPLLTISGRDSYGKIILRAFYQMKEPGFFYGYF